jgi:hypothetical protein
MSSAPRSSRGAVPFSHDFRVKLTMSTETHIDPPPVSKTRLWTGRVFSGLSGILMLVDGVAKVIKPKEVVEKTTELGFPESVIAPLGAVLIACAVLYLIPRTSVLGAILLTGYLGGAVCAHVRLEQGPLVAGPIIFAALLWGGLCLRNRRVSDAVFAPR